MLLISGFKFNDAIVSICPAFTKMHSIRGSLGASIIRISVRSSLESSVTDRGDLSKTKKALKTFENPGEGVEKL